MSFDWNAVWKPRAESFNKANLEQPNARNGERDPLIELLDFAPSQSFLEVAPGGGCLLRGVNQTHSSIGIEYFAVEPSDPFASDLPDYVTRIPNSDIVNFDCEDGRFDRVANLAGLHHTNPRSGFFTESFRVLKHGGILAIADVGEDTHVARWLNEFVNEFNEFGHDGAFFSPGEMHREMSAAGFADVSESCVDAYWRFGSLTECVDYFRNLFYLNLASDEQVLGGIRKYFDIEVTNAEVLVPWTLVYARGIRP